jgi:hypothetical protein
MKKYITIFSIILCHVTTLSAQSLYTDNVFQFSQNIYEGTARFQGMGGAFAALGGDFTSLSINPAGVAVYRSSELSITPVLGLAGTSADYLSKSRQESKTSFGLGNISYVAALPTYQSEGLVSVNFGIGFNKLQNTRQRYSATGRDRTSMLSDVSVGLTGIDYEDVKSDNYRQRGITELERLAWNVYLIDTIPGYTNQYWGATEDYDDPNDPRIEEIKPMGELDKEGYRNQSGYVGEYAFSMGVNLSDRFYFGATFGVQHINNDLFVEYQEKAVDAARFRGGFRGFTYSSSMITEGTGYNLKFGAIVRPVGGLRLGAYIHTPTWMFLTEKWTEEMSSLFATKMHNDRVSGAYDYRIHSPFKWGAGLAYTFGNAALISVDYEGVDFSAAALSSPYERSAFDADNEYLKKNYRTTTNIRVGGEVRIAAIALRAGYSYYQHPMKNEPARQIGSVGIGYRGRYFYIDGAYSFIPNVKQAYGMYASDPNTITTDTFFSNIAVTVGIRF